MVILRHLERQEYLDFLKTQIQVYTSFVTMGNTQAAETLTRLLAEYRTELFEKPKLFKDKVTGKSISPDNYIKKHEGLFKRDNAPGTVFKVKKAAKKLSGDVPPTDIRNLFNMVSKGN